MAEKMTRRTFMKSAAAAAAAISLSGVLVGCGSSGQLADDEVQIGPFTVKVFGLDVDLGTESGTDKGAITGKVRLRYDAGGGSWQGGQYGDMFQAFVGEAKLKQVSPAGTFFVSDTLLGKPFATEEKDLRLNFPDAEIKEAYRNGQPAVLKIVIKLAAAFEAVGIVLLLFAFVPQFGAEGVWVSVFTAISAFCNAGFDLFGRFGAYSSLVPYVNNYYVQAVVMFMIMAGGLGFMVWVELAEYRKKRHLSLHAKVVLQFSAIFWVGGAVLLALLEWSNPKTMGGLSVPSKLMAALFQSVSTRTAGMNTIDLAACSPISKLLMSVLQFIGAAPGSTGGGVKVTTFAVLILTIRSVAQGRDDCVIGGHHIESKTVYRALTIIVLGAVAAFGSAVVVYYNTAETVSVIDCIFESCSAFGTVGLSVGVTGQLNTGAKLLYMACMFMGRVGPASLAISLTAKPDDNKRKVLPVGHINVG